ncbi:MAG: alpha/beta fold hydrolase [Ignavibacteriales bacterium]|nr:alpha/beta fold hydrolase [Ignavibacteriales bacterium]
MNYEILVEQFCTPPQQEDTDFDRKAFAQAQLLDIEFEDRILKCYSMGTGQDVLLVHGWNSRASHMALLARYLVNNGFHVIVFDGPAHGYSRRREQKDMSNMFEFGRAVSCVAKNMGNIYAVIGHSFGATVAAFITAGTGLLSEYRIAAEKLILISAPESVSRIIENYSRNRNEMDAMTELTQSLERVFDFKVSDYTLSLALKRLDARILIIHDEQDEEIPVSVALRLKETSERSKLVLTRGSGHQKILINRDMLNAVREFLSV